MIQSRAAYRYALSLLSVAGETGRIEQVSTDFEMIERLIKSSSDFSLFLKTPVISTIKKKAVLETILRDHVDELTMKFVRLLVSKNRESVLSEVIRQFYRLRDERLGILDVTARTAVPFTKTQEEDLVNRIGQVTKKKVRIHFIQDPLLKGGFTIQYEDTVWDASIRRQLESLRQKFVMAAS
jgi:F-type H+-transporting ATPase subunit delta